MQTFLKHKIIFSICFLKQYELKKNNLSFKGKFMQNQKSPIYSQFKLSLRTSQIAKWILIIAIVNSNYTKIAKQFFSQGKLYFPIFN